MRGRFTVQDMGVVRKLGLVAGAVLALVVAGWHAPGAAAAGGPTTTSISFSSNPASAGQQVTITVTVRGTLFSPLGVVLLFDGPVALGASLLTPDFDGSFFCDACIPTDHSTATVTRSFGRGDHIITAFYPGDPEDFSSPGGPTTLTVNPAASATVVASSADPSVHGQDVTFTATVGSTGARPSGTVQFKVDGNDYGAAQTLGTSGDARIDASDLDVGDHAVTAVFTSDNPDVEGSTGLLFRGFVPVKQTVDPAHTSTSITSSADPSEFGDTVTFTSTTSVVAPGAGRPTGTVQFEDNGAPLGPPRTLDGSGQAALTTSDLPVGPHTIDAVYTSDVRDFDGSTGSVAQAVDRAATTLVYDGATTSDFDDPATLSARLVRTHGGAPIAGKTVKLTLASEACTATTDAAGEASCAITPSEAAASYTVTAGFTGDAGFVPATVSTTFVVTKEETTTAYTGPTAILQGQTVTVSGRLLEDGVEPIAGRTLTLTLGPGAAAQSCTGVTDATGSAHCVLPAVTVAQGPEPLAADFAGDAYYVPSSGAATAIVFAFPSRGAFVLGDTTAAHAGSSTVTFWGSQWSSLNTLTGGGAAASFKGFAATTSSTPPVCGGRWTTGPGDSPSPVASLPAYMGTVIASSVVKFGSSISGNIVGIAVVQTAAGYAADPGHAGAGAIVAWYC
jgi:Big-like domain-containing protein